MSVNPFSTSNSLDHIINPKLIGGGLTGYSVALDLVDIDTTYTRQIGNPTHSVQQAFIQQLGTAGVPTQQAFIQQLGSTLSHGQAYFTQIGSTGITGYVGDGYFNNLYYTNLVPYPGVSGTSGIVAGQGILISGSGGSEIVSMNIQAGTGITFNNPGNGQPYIISSSILPTSSTYVQGSTSINVSLTGSTYTVNSLVAVIGSTGINVKNSGPTFTVESLITVTGSSFINVQQNGATFTVTYTGTQNGSSGLPSGTPNSYAVYNSNGNLTSSTVLTSTNVVGPTGQVMLYSSQGPTSTSLVSVNTQNREFSAPTTIIHDYGYYGNSGSFLRLTQDSTSSYINSGSSNVRESAAPLNISAYASGRTLTKFDVPNGLVTINPNSSYPLNGNPVIQTSVAGTFTPTAGATYNIYAWGGGGAGLSGYAGGAGGFISTSLVSDGTTMNWNSQAITGMNGGGDGVMFILNGALLPIFVVAGGGAGGSNGKGAAFGESGGSYPGQGYSAVNGAATGGIYLETIQQTTYYTLGQTGITVSGGIFENILVEYGLIGNLSAGTTIKGYGAIPNVHGSTFTTYYFPPGSTLVFQTNGITFENSSYSLTGITGGIINTNFNLPSGSTFGGTLSHSPVGGTASSNSNNTGITGIQIQGGYIGGTFVGDGSGLDQMLLGQTFSIGQTGLTLTVNYGTVFTDYGITGGIEIDFLGGLTFNFSRSLGQVIAPKVYIQDPIFISPHSVVQVANVSSNIYGNYGYGTYDPNTGLVGTSVYGGGGGSVGGGGGIQGGGGGAGENYIKNGVVATVQSGSGITPYLTTYNLDGKYGFGGSGTIGGSPYIVIEQVVPTQSTVLQVNGSETITGNLTSQTTYSGAYIGTSGSPAGCPKGLIVGSTGITIQQAGSSATSVLTTTTTGGGSWQLNLSNGLNVTQTLTGSTGTFSGNLTANDVTATSDIRLKENIVTVDSALDKIQKLRGVYFNKLKSEKRSLGVIAQEIEEIIPEVVFTDSEGMKSVAYGNIVGLLIEGLKEQQKQIDELKQNTK